MASRKVPEVIFTAIAKDGSLSFMNEQDLHDYCVEHDNEQLFIHVEPEAQLSEKQRMYAYYHRVILPCAVLGYTYAGYSGVDNVKADYLLRAEFAKTFVQGPKGEYIPIIQDKRDMTKARLHKYMEDCILFIEHDLQQRVPDSEEYILKKQTGQNFKIVK